MGKVTISFTLDTEEDKDILRWLKRQDRRRRSLAIREALRERVMGGITLGDVYQAVKDLERKMRSGSVTIAPVDDDTDWDEPPEAAAALDALAKM